MSKKLDEADFTRRLSQMSKKIEEADFIGAGFKKLDPTVVELNNPPKIQWGELHKGQSIEEQRDRAQKLAGSMNHAAYLLQGERDELQKLCQQKEMQLRVLSRDVVANNRMLQSEVTKINEERQQFNKAYAALNAEVKALRAAANGTND